MGLSLHIQAPRPGAPWRMRRTLSAALRRAGGVLAVSCVLLAPAPVRAQASPTALSQAETLLFETDHLARIQPPAVLVYAFRKVSNVEPGFGDEVRLDIVHEKSKGKDKGKDKDKVGATLHFLSGAHRHDIPALEEAHGNPVLLGFLERDIAEMKRLTGGSPAYFRKRIRMALAEAAQVSAQTIDYQGKAVPAQAIRIQPYLDDPMHARFEPYVHKTYTFVVSAGVPGGIYQLRSTLANQDYARMAGAATSGRAAETAAAKGADAAGVARTAARVAASGAPATGAPATGLPAAGAPAVGAGQDKAAAAPEIDETLTLVRVAHPGR